MFIVLCLLSSATAAPPPSGKTVALPNAPGVTMPSINLGTCCGSEPSVGLASWLAAGGKGIDTAWDYHDEADIATVLAAPGMPKRDELFITTKVPAGFGNKTDCDDPAQLPMIAYNYVKDNLRQLGVEQVDLALIHRPCGPSKFPPKDAVASNNALWKGMQMVLKDGLARAIGVSNYAAADLKALDMSKAVPAVNQCQMSVEVHDDESIAYSQSKGIVYESYFTMKGCPFADKDLASIAAAHNASVAQVCLRWVLDRGGIIACGTGANATTVGPYAKENLGIYDFQLTAAEVKILDGKGKQPQV